MKSKLLVLAVMLALASSASLFAAGGTGLIVGSKIDTEGSVLGKMIVKLLAANGIPVVDKVGFGTTDLVRKAIVSGELDLYIEYTGNGEFFFKGSDPAIWKDAAKGYETVKKLDLDANGIVWLTPAPANNTWAIAVRKDLADKERLVTLEDFAAYVRRGGATRLAASEEFISSPAALPAFQKAYGFQLKDAQLLSFSGGNTALTEQAAAQGTNGVNFAMAYGTDGALAALGLVVLTDTKAVQPVYEPAPIVRKEALARYPAIAGLLDKLFKGLDLVTLQSLNARVAVNGESPDAVAASYLMSKGLVK
ncbi:MAG TPA: ABC transporter substrate-binding protein [Rectinemataceae bacterium]|nr:ABC transporter substrate-binding protein [Rectinemataceae bacterium]